MLDHARTLAVVSLLLLAPGLVRAQEAHKSDDKPVPHLKLVFRTIDLSASGKIIDSHIYAALAAANTRDRTSEIRSVDKIPIITGVISDNGHDNTQYQYQEVGTRIDSSQLNLNGNVVTLRVVASISEVVKNDFPKEAHTIAPIFRSLSWDSNVVVSLEHPAILFSSDNISGGGKTELELTASEIK